MGVDEGNTREERLLGHFEIEDVLQNPISMKHSCREILIVSQAA